MPQHQKIVHQFLPSTVTFKGLQIIIIVYAYIGKLKINTKLSSIIDLIPLSKNTFTMTRTLSRKKKRHGERLKQEIKKRRPAQVLLMTSNETKEWMRQKDYLKHWILPSHGLFDHDPDLARYNNNPIGNSPELMPWDNCLNEDVKRSFSYHQVTQIPGIRQF